MQFLFICLKRTAICLFLSSNNFSELFFVNHYNQLEFLIKRCHYFDLRILFSPVGLWFVENIFQHDPAKGIVGPEIHVSTSCCRLGFFRWCVLCGRAVIKTERQLVGKGGQLRKDGGEPG